MKSFIIFIFILISINLFSLEVTRSDTLNFGYISEGKRQIPPHKGARIFIKGIPGKIVEIKSEDIMTFESNGSVLKLEKISFDNKEITLDKRGKGVFKVGGVISVVKKRTPGNINKELWVSFKYKN